MTNMWELHWLMLPKRVIIEILLFAMRMTMGILKSQQLLTETLRERVRNQKIIVLPPEKSLMRRAVI